MAKVNFTAGRIADFQCESGKSQSFLWDSTAPGLGLRATAIGAKSYIFQAKLNDQAMRLTIGSPDTWTITAAQVEARRLKVMIDGGQDPRQVKADKEAQEQSTREAEAAQRAAIQAQQVRESVTLGMVWPEYVAERTPLWSAHHIAAHRKIIQAGGEQRSRSPKPTKSGPLAQFANLPIGQLTPIKIETWARSEAKSRPSYARLALRLLKACLNWCAVHPVYAALLTTNAATSDKARESLGKPKKKIDVLQREQLAAWFAAVKQIGNPVIAAYLQCLLITGARREELAKLKWVDVDFQWHSLKLNDKIEDFRMVPLTPYTAHLMAALPRRNEFVFSSPTAASGSLAEPRIAHNQAVASAGLPLMTLHGLRRSFASLSEWVEMPSGIAAQIQGHAPQGVREQNYIRRPLDLLRKWHVQIEAWMLEQAGIEYAPVQAGLRAVR